MTMITRPVGSLCVHTALTCESVGVRWKWVMCLFVLLCVTVCKCVCVCVCVFGRVSMCCLRCVVGCVSVGVYALAVVRW